MNKKHKGERSTEGTHRMRKRGHKEKKDIYRKSFVGI